MGRLACALVYSGRAPQRTTLFVELAPKCSEPAAGSGRISCMDRGFLRMLCRRFRSGSPVPMQREGASFVALTFRYLFRSHTHQDHRALDRSTAFIFSCEGFAGRLCLFLERLRDVEIASLAQGRMMLSANSSAFSKCAVWFNDITMRPDAVVRFDPGTENIQSWSVPSGPIMAGIIRHMRPNGAGGLWVHQDSTNRIGRTTLGR